MELKPIGWTIGVGYGAETDTSGAWLAHGYRVAGALDVGIDRAAMFRARFRTWYGASTGTVDNGVKLATTDGWEVGAGLLLGVRIAVNDTMGITPWVGYSLGFGVMDVQTTQAGDDKWRPDCPSFSEVMEEPTKIRCWLEGMDGTYTSGKFLAEVDLDFGAIVLTPFYEYSMNNAKRGRVLADGMHKVGVMVGVEF